MCLESNKVAARGIMEESFLAATRATLDGYCTMNCVEVVLRVYDTDKKDDEEARNNLFRMAGLKLILRALRAVLVIIRLKSEYLVKELSKGKLFTYYIMLGVKGKPTLFINIFICLKWSLLLYFYSR